MTSGHRKRRRMTRRLTIGILAVFCAAVSPDKTGTLFAALAAGLYLSPVLSYALDRTARRLVRRYRR